MRSTRSTYAAAIFGLGIAAIATLTSAQAPPASSASQQAPAPKAEPSLDDRARQAVATMAKGGRIARPTSFDAMTPEQQALVRSILSGKRNGIDGSLGIMLPSPAMGDVAQKGIEYARFNPTIPPKLNEMAILIAARAWTAQVAWHVHSPSALRAGLPADVIAAIQAGKRPANMTPDVEAVYDFCTELVYKRQMSDATFAAAKNVLGGDKGVVDLVATLGFYQLVSMMMDVDQMPLPNNAKPDLAPLPTPYPSGN